MGERVREYLTKQKLSPPVKDGIFIKTLPDALILAGGRPRGSLYAVYTFLEDAVGVRWWTSSESTVPRKPTLRIPDLDTSYCPKLLYREAYYRDPLDNSSFAARMKLNGHMSSIPESLGGHYTIIGWCHTSYEFLPPGVYFGAHPDWYSLQNGKRSPGGGQLCWSNAEMRRELARQALARIRKQPTAGIISISQNDCLGACQCDACRAIEKAEGAPSGPLIQGINAVAAEIGKEFPDFLIETLAYQYSRKPPARIRPAANVLVRLCSIEADNSHALSSDANAGFRDDLRGWKTIAPNLFVWNYVTSFANYLIPHPNMTPLGADLRFFAENNVIGVFEQGDAMNGTGDFLPLRVWLLAHLMWDPSRDQAALREEFLQGYYGPAAPYLAQYLDLVNAPAQSASFRLSCYNNDTSFLSDAALVEAARLFDRAEMAVAGSSDWARRVKRERLVLDHLQLLRYDFPGLPRAARKGDESVCRDYDARTVRFIEAAKEMGVHNLAEGQSFDSYIPVLKARSLRYLPPPRMPVPGTALPEGCFDIQEDRFNLVGAGNWSELTTDSKASNGKAARMAGHHTNWAVQFHIPQGRSVYGARPLEMLHCRPLQAEGPKRRRLRLRIASCEQQQLHRARRRIAGGRRR